MNKTDFGKKYQENVCGGKLREERPCGRDETAAAFRSMLGPENVRENEPMKLHTTFRIGGQADFFLTPANKEQLEKTAAWCRANGEPFFVMGNGSNLLVSDNGYRGTVIQLGRKFSDIRTDGLRIMANAGARLSLAAARAADESLTGLEFAGGIPGTVGGACLMNAGAYGGEMKQVLVSVTVIGRDGRTRVCGTEEMDLGYRHSAFMERGDIVVSAEMRLTRGRKQEIAGKMEELRRKRQEKQPLDMPSAGSTFKRPEGFYAGKLIMEAGLRGFAVGGAQVSEKHCGFVVNRGGASADDVRRLIGEVRKRVFEHAGVMLEPEIRFLGDF